MRGVVARMDEISGTLSSGSAAKSGDKNGALIRSAHELSLSVARRSAELRCDKRETKAPSGNAQQ